MSPQNINHPAQDAMKTDQSLEAIKVLLSDAETTYAHAIARGDWEAMAPAKREVAKLRNMVRKIIMERMS